MRVLRAALRLSRRLRVDQLSVQHTLGTWDFGGLREVLLWRGVLSPRPETEDLAAIGGELLLAERRSPSASAEQRLAEALCKASPFGGAAPWASLINPSAALAAALACASDERRGTTIRRLKGGHPGPPATSDDDSSADSSAHEVPLALLDMGSGTGVVGIAALARARSEGCVSCRAVLLDVDRDSVRLGAANAARQEMGGVATTVQADAGGDLDGPLQEAARTAGAASVVLANPPYLPAAAMEEVAAHVARGEAGRCLEGGGADGLREPLRWLEAILRGERSVRTGAVVGLELDSSHPEALWRMSRGEPLPANGQTVDLWERSGSGASGGFTGGAAGAAGPMANADSAHRPGSEGCRSGTAEDAPRRRLRWLTGQRDVMDCPRFVWLQVVEAP